MKKQIRMIICTSTIFLLLFVSPVMADMGKSISVEKLIQRGQETVKKINDGVAKFSWVTQLAINGATVQVTNIIDGAKKVKSICLIQDGAETELFTIIEQKGVWYVRDQGNPLGKYRPYEAPLSFPNAYLLLDAGDIHTLTKETVAQVQSVKGNVAFLRMETPPRLRNQIQSNIDAIQDVINKLENKSTIEKCKKQIAQLKQAMENGHQISVDVDTGVILKHETMVMESKVIFFVPRSLDDNQDFDIDSIKCRDLTHDPTKEKDLNNLLMISNSPLANSNNVNQLKDSMDVRLLNIRTNEIRRIPFRGPALLAGCFSRNRKKVYISGMDLETGGLALYEINLSTGENRRIGQGELPDGMAMKPTLSFAESQLAVMMFSPNLNSQIYLLNLRSEKARKLGMPMDTAFVSWLDDGKGLILASRKMISPNKPTEDSVARMNLEGKLTILVKGEQPALVPNAKRILFLQDNKWKTCNIEGGDVKLYVDGMKEYGFPAISADGKRIIWLRYEKGKMPQPVLQEFGKIKISDLNFGPGLWALPVWR